MDEPLRVNRQAWDECAAIHVQGNPSYPVEEFKAGKAGLRPNTPDDLGDVRGQLLHLQCHFGLDSLMWVRQGADRHRRRFFAPGNRRSAKPGGGDRARSEVHRSRCVQSARLSCGAI